MEHDFSAFVRSPQDGHHNPWPGMIDRTDLDQPTSLPVLRALWLPGLTYPPDTRSPFIAAALFHETTHLLFHFTPVNLLVRFLLADSYKVIQGLLNIPNPTVADIQAAADYLKTADGRILDLLEPTELAEEVLVTAMTKASWPPTSRWDAPTERETKTFEALIDNAYNERFPMFRELVSQMHDVLALCAFSGGLNFAHLARVAIFLCAVKFTQLEGSPLFAPNSGMPKLEELFSIAREANGNPGRFSHAIGARLHEDDHFIPWRTLLFQQETARRNSDFLSALLSIEKEYETSHSPRIKDDVMEQELKLVNWPGPLPPEGKPVVILPKRFSDRWVIGTGSIEVNSGHGILLFYESVRQQILEKSGFSCPLFSGDEQCMCRRTPLSPLQDRLKRICEVGGSLLGWSLRPPCC